jgi:hypothetical protein
MSNCAFASREEPLLPAEVDIAIREINERLFGGAYKVNHNSEGWWELGLPSDNDVCWISVSLEDADPSRCEVPDDGDWSAEELAVFLDPRHGWNRLSLSWPAGHVAQWVFLVLQMELGKRFGCTMSDEGIEGWRVPKDSLATVADWYRKIGAHVKCELYHDFARRLWVQIVAECPEELKPFLGEL